LSWVNEELFNPKTTLTLLFLDKGRVEAIKSKVLEMLSSVVKMKKANWDNPIG
jgi:hypothetical protein